MSHTMLGEEPVRWDVMVVLGLLQHANARNEVRKECISLYNNIVLEREGGGVGWGAGGKHKEKVRQIDTDGRVPCCVRICVKQVRVV